MKKFIIIFVISLAMPFYLAHAAKITPVSIEKQSFDDWVIDLKTEASKKGISKKTLDKAFENIKFNEKIVALDRRQTEFTFTFWEYLDRMVNNAKVNTGKSLKRKYRTLLRRVEQKYGVPGNFIIAFWGLETNFGMHFGGFNVIEALSTLAYDDRRPEFFRKELLHVLKISDDNKIPPDKMKSSWAGAMGHFQFMPSTYARYAVDFDNDGKKDIWNSLPDAFASAANYLSDIGWKKNQKWGREVVLPENLSWVKLNRNLTRTVTDWIKAEIKPADKRAMFKSKMKATIVFPGGHKGPAFLTYPNFSAITDWNKSMLYAIAVGHFADRVGGAGKLKTPRKKLYVPTRAEVKEAQTLLKKLGFYDGNADGVAGINTRKGIRIAQQRFGLPIDGYLSKELVKKMKLY